MSLTPKDLQQIRKDNELKQRDLAAVLGVSRSLVSMMESGERNIPDDAEDLIAKAGYSTVKGVAGGLVSLAGTPLRPIPILGKVSAGSGLSNVDPDASQVYVPDNLAKAGGRGYIVEGDSMIGGPNPSKDLEEGDVAVFKESPTARNRFTFLLKSPEGEYKVKTLRFDGQWTEISRNPAHAPQPLGKDQIIGYLIGFYRSKGTYEKVEIDTSGLILD